MLSWIRERFGPVVVGGIIGMIALVFILSDALSPRATRGMHSGAVAGTVNGDVISLSDFSRAYNRQVEMFQQMTGGKMKLSDDQLKAFRIRERVFQDLVRRRLMVQEAARLGMAPSDEEVRDQIRQYPAFQKNGAFDSVQYRQVLESNNYTPGGFESLIRDDITAQGVDRYFLNRARVSASEIEEEFLSRNNRRDVRYVLLTSEAGKKRLSAQLTGEEVKGYLAKPEHGASLKATYEGRKERDLKGKTFEQAQEQLAREALVAEPARMEAVKKENQALAQKVAGILTADKKSDGAVKTALEGTGVDVRATGMITQGAPYLPGIGEAKELLKDAFADRSPIDPAAGGKAKVYSSANWYLVAVISASEKPQREKLEAERESLAEEIRFRRMQELREGWLKGLVKRAKVDPNPSVVGDAAADLNG